MAEHLLLSCLKWAAERQRYFPESIDIKDVFQYYLNLVEFLISLGHLPDGLITTITPTKISVGARDQPLLLMMCIHHRLILFWFLPCDAVQSTVMLSYIVCLSVCRPSVCLSVAFRYHDHRGWNSSKIISRPNSLRPVLGGDPNMGHLVQREHSQNCG